MKFEVASIFEVIFHSISRSLFSFASNVKISFDVEFKLETWKISWKIEKKRKNWKTFFFHFLFSTSYILSFLQQPICAKVYQHKLYLLMKKVCLKSVPFFLAVYCNAQNKLRWIFFKFLGILKFKCQLYQRPFIDQNFTQSFYANLVSV